VPQAKKTHSEAVLLRLFRHTSLTPAQEATLRAVLRGQDAILKKKLGSGNSLTLPAMALGKVCLLVKPLKRLVNDQAKALKKAGVHIESFLSDISSTEKARVLRTLLGAPHKAVDVIVGDCGHTGSVTTPRPHRGAGPPGRTRPY